MQIKLVKVIYDQYLRVEFLGLVIFLIERNLKYLYQESANLALNTVLFLMLWCWCCSLNSPLEGAVPVFFKDYDAKFELNTM